MLKDIKAVLIQQFKFDINTDIFALIRVIPINQFYPTDIIKLTDTSLLTDISDHYLQQA